MKYLLNESSKYTLALLGNLYENVLYEKNVLTEDDHEIKDIARGSLSMLHKPKSRGCVVRVL